MKDGFCHRLTSICIDLHQLLPCLKCIIIFCRAFNVFLNGSSAHETQEHNFNAYKQRVAEITVAFRRISEEIIHIKNSLRDTHNKAEISAIIEKVQDLEEAKLKTVGEVFLQRARIPLAVALIDFLSSFCHRE